MLARSHRVGTRLFDEILASGKTRHSPLFSLRIMPLTDSKATTKDKSSFRLSIAVPKKTSNKAVARHKIRRQAAAVVRKERERIVPGWAGILFVKPTASALLFKDFEKELVTFLEQNGILTKAPILKSKAFQT